MLRHLIYPFLVYRSFFFPFFELSLFVVPCWLIFRAYRLRSSGQRLSLGHEILLLIFVFYLCGLASATLSPNHPSLAHATATRRIELRPNLAALTCSAANLPSGSNGRFFCLYNAKGNILLFLPLGFLLPLVRRRLRFGNAVAIAIAVSACIELLQYVSAAWGSHRLADVNDVILNTLGASIGLTVVYLLRFANARVSGSRPPSAEPAHQPLT